MVKTDINENIGSRFESSTVTTACMCSKSAWYMDRYAFCFFVFTLSLTYLGDRQTLKSRRKHSDGPTVRMTDGPLSDVTAIRFKPHGGGSGYTFNRMVKSSFQAMFAVGE